MHATCLVRGIRRSILPLWLFASMGAHQSLLQGDEGVLRSSCGSPAPVRRGGGVGNVGSELPAKGKGKGKAKVERSRAGQTKPLESDATSRPSARSAAKPLSMKATVARAEKKRKADDEVPTLSA